ncbi:MAG: zf-TFIIB domain-containing protein [Pyrobaculum sp.]
MDACPKCGGAWLDGGELQVKEYTSITKTRGIELGRLSTPIRKRRGGYSTSLKSC